MTNNVDQRRALVSDGMPVGSTEELWVTVVGEQIPYLEAKRDRMGHEFGRQPGHAAPVGPAEASS